MKEEHRHVAEMLRKQAEEEQAIKHGHKMRQGVRAADVIEASWGGIVAQAVQQVLASCGDHILEASTFSVPDHLTLREAAAASRSALYSCILVAAMQAALDGGCVLLARNVRRALRRRLRRLTPLLDTHTERPDSLLAMLHLNWGGMLLASTGKPPGSVRRGSAPESD